MFIDWLKCSQEFDKDLPVVSGIITKTFDTITGECLSSRTPWFEYEGSHSSKISVQISGRKITVDGNPSRLNRKDNVWGFKTVGECIAVYNELLAEYGLPPFTRCTRFELRQTPDGKATKVWSDGCILHRIDLTTNVSVGKDKELPYLRALSSQRIGKSIGRLLPNGFTVDWTTSGAGKGARLQYRKAYGKANDLKLHFLPKVKRAYGESSDEYKYAVQLFEHALERGIVRFEQELKDEFLKREKLSYWGMFDESKFGTLHAEFINVDERLKVTKMSLAGIAEQLLLEKAVDTPRKANMTASYAVMWMHGQDFVLSERQFETHAARLNKIGINIRNTPDLKTFSMVFVRELQEINPIKGIEPPAWYEKPRHLKLVK